MALQMSLHYPTLSVLPAGLCGTGHFHPLPSCHFSTGVVTIHSFSHVGPKSSPHSLEGTHPRLGLRTCGLVGVGLLAGWGGRKPRPACSHLPSGFPLHSQGQAFEESVQLCRLLQLRGCSTGARGIRGHWTRGLSLSRRALILWTHEGVQQAPGTWSLI